MSDDDEDASIESFGGRWVVPPEEPILTLVPVTGLGSIWLQVEDIDELLGLPSNATESGLDSNGLLDVEDCWDCGVPGGIVDWKVEAIFARILLKNGPRVVVDVIVVLPIVEDGREDALESTW